MKIPSELSEEITENTRELSKNNVLIFWLGKYLGIPGENSQENTGENVREIYA